MLQLLVISPQHRQTVLSLLVLVLFIAELFPHNSDLFLELLDLDFPMTGVLLIQEGNIVFIRELFSKFGDLFLTDGHLLLMPLLKCIVFPPPHLGRSSLIFQTLIQLLSFLNMLIFEPFLCCAPFVLLCL